SNNENIKSPEGKERTMDFAAKFLNGSANGLETILGILHEASPSVFGVADLMAEVRHEAAPCKREGRTSIWREICAREEGESRGKELGKELGKERQPAILVKGKISRN